MVTPAIAVLSVFMFLQLCSGKIPVRPKLSDEFSAELTALRAGAEQKSMSYINYKEQKLMQIVDLGSDAGTGHVQTIVLAKSNTIYNYFDAFDFCTSEAALVTVIAEWSWLQNATFKSTEEFMGMQVDVWTYTNKTDGTTYEAGVLSADPETPVYMANSNGLPVLVSNFSNSAPPESKFAVPPACEHAEAFPQKNPPHHSGSNFALFKRADV